MQRKYRHSNVPVQLPIRIHMLAFVPSVLIGLTVAFVSAWVFLGNLAPVAAEIVRSVVPHPGAALLLVAALGVMLGCQIYGRLIKSWERAFDRI